jgi:hypothetical protein
MINIDSIINDYKKKAAANKVAADSWKGAHKEKYENFMNQNELIDEFVKTLSEIKKEITPLLEA